MLSHLISHVTVCQNVDLQVIDAAVGGSSAAVGVVGGVAGAAHQATVTTVDQTQIITLQVGPPVKPFHILHLFNLHSV